MNYNIMANISKNLTIEERIEKVKEFVNKNNEEDMETIKEKVCLNVKFSRLERIQIVDNLLSIASELGKNISGLDLKIKLLDEINTILNLAVVE